jgi:hypothetical protein
MRTRRWVLLCCGGLLVIAAAALFVSGSVVLLDSKREVASAHLIDGWGHKHALLNLVYLYVGLPSVEGAVQISCKNGSIVERGYVTSGIHTWQKMDGTGRCSTIDL